MAALATVPPPIDALPPAELLLPPVLGWFVVPTVELPPFDGTPPAVAVVVAAPLPPIDPPVVLEVVPPVLLAVPPAALAPPVVVT